MPFSRLRAESLSVMRSAVSWPIRPAGTLASSSRPVNDLRPLARLEIGYAGPSINIQRLPIRVAWAANLREMIVEEWQRPVDASPNVGT